MGADPLAAIISGALCTMAVAFLCEWTAREASLFAALAALGIELIGQETYSQTIELLCEPDTRLWKQLGIEISEAACILLFRKKRLRRQILSQAGNTSHIRCDSASRPPLQFCC